MSEKVAIITGGGRGIGRAICERFGSAGVQVVAASRTPEELEETRRLVEAAGGKCEVRPTDLCEPDEINSLIEGTVGRFKRIDVLVNCAGVAPQATLEDLDSPVFDMLNSVNIKAIYHTCRAVWPIMKKQKSGVIVGISSAASVDPFPGFSAYGASKAWLNTWTKSLADEGKRFGIRVFAVAPGAVETKMLRDAFPDFPADQALSPQDVAYMVYTLAQSGCQHATGQTVFIKK